jgi:hypothetical protein
VAALVVADFYLEYISLEYLTQKFREQSVSLRPISVVMSSFPLVLQQVCTVLLPHEQHYWKPGRKQFSFTVVNRNVLVVSNTHQNLNTKVIHHVY